MSKPTLLSKEKVGFRSDGSLTGLRSVNENSAFVGGGWESNYHDQRCSTGTEASAIELNI
jgi:hypothetical protein